MMDAALPAAASSSVNRLGVRLALIAIGVVSTLPILLKPIMVGALEDQAGLSRAEVAYVPAIEQIGAGLVSLVLAPLLNQRDRRWIIAFGLAALAAANVASLFAAGLAAFLIARFAAGLGGGAALGVVKADFAGAKDPERLFAIYSVTILLVGAGASPLLAQLAVSHGMTGLFGALLALSVLVLPLAFLTPASGPREPAKPAGNAAAPSLNAGIARALVGTACFFAAVGMFWPFAERIGVSLGLTATQAGGVIGVSLLGGAGGALLAAILGARFGRAAPLIAGLVVSIAAMALVALGEGAAVFTAAVTLFVFSWFFSFPYILGLMAADDPSGRIVVLAYVAQTLFTGVGPILATWYMSALAVEPPALAWAGVVGFVGALAAFAPRALAVDARA